MKKVLLLLCCWLTALGLSAANPDKIYLIGNICGWFTFDSVEPDEVTDGVYTWKNANMKDSGDGSSYFAFVGKKTSGTSNNWDGVGTRYGAASKDLAITKNSPKGILNNENSWKVDAGYYKVVVDLNKKQVTLYDPEGDPDPDPVVDPTIDPNDCYIFFDNSVSKWSEVGVWAWGDENSTDSGTWPGDKMEKRSDGLYQWKLPEGKPVPHTIMFNDNKKEGADETDKFVFVNKSTYNKTGDKGVDTTLEYEVIQTPDPEDPDPVVPTEDVIVYVEDLTSANIYFYNDDKGQYTDWDHAPAMSKDTATGYLMYKLPAGYETCKVIIKNGGAQYPASGGLDVNGKSMIFNWSSQTWKEYTTPTRPEMLYVHLYTQDGYVGSSEFVKAIAGEWNGNTCTFTIEGSKDATESYNVLLSSAAKYSNGIELYGPTEKTTALPCADSAFGKFADKKFYTIAANANYTVSVDWDAQTLTATKQKINDPDDPVNPDDPTEDVIVYVKGLDAANIYYYADGVKDIGWDNAPAMTKDTATGYLMYTLPEEFHSCSVIIRYSGGQYPGANQPGKEVNGKSMILDWETKSWTAYTGGNGGDDPEISGMKPTGTLPVLYINVCEYTLGVDDKGKEVVNYTRDENGDLIYINEIIDRNLKHKDYFNHAQYWIDANGLEGFENLGSADKPLDLNIKARGNFTRKGYAKKPFKLKLDKKQNLLGINRKGEKSKHWAILAHADDEYGYMRNFVGFRLGEMIGLPWTPNQQPIEVVINGDYRGIYFLTESIRVGDGRVPITELADNATNPTDLTGGYLVELDNYIDDCTFSLPDASNKNADPQYGSLMVTADSPEAYSDQQLRFITEQFTKMNDLVNGNDDSELWSYLDLDDAARYYVVEEIISHYEAYHGSTYLYRDRATETDNGKWHFSPLWDCGHAFDGNPEQFFPDMERYGNHTSYGNTWIGNKDGKGLRHKAKFMDKVKNTFQWFINKEVNNGKSPYEQLCEEIDAYATNIATAAKADRERWKNAPKPDEIYWTDGSQPQDVVDNSDMTGKRDQVKSILEKKINWLKKDYNWGSEKLAEPDRDTTPAAELPAYVKEGYEPKTLDLYVVNDGNWNGVNVYLYNKYEDNSEKEYKKWPGDELKLTDANIKVNGATENIYHFTVPEDFIKYGRVIFKETNGDNRYPADKVVGLALNEKDMVFFTKQDNNKYVFVEAVVEDITPKPYSGTLPVVHISTPSTNTNDGVIRYIGYGEAGKITKATVTIDGLDTGFASITAGTSVKGRGGDWKESTDKSNSKFKNSFKLKTDKITPFGMAESAHWVLMPYTYDAANGLLSNYAGHELSRLIGLEWTPSMQPVELMIDGEYMGLYFFAENVRAAADRVQIADYGDTAPKKKEYNMEHDFLLEIDADHDENDASELFHTWNHNGFDNKLVTATPALEDIKTTDEVTRITEYLVNHIENLQGVVADAAQNPMSEAWAEIIDAEQAAKYYIVQELMDDSRSFTNNFYIHHTWENDEVEGGVKGTKWFFGPVWDFSGAFSQNGNKTQLFHEADGWKGTFIKDLYANKHFVWIVGATFYKFVNGEKMPEVSSQRMLAKGQYKAASIHDDYDPVMSNTITDVNTSIDDMVDQIQEAVVTDAARWPDYAAHSSESSLQVRSEAVKTKIAQHQDYLSRSIANGGAGWNLEDITTGIEDIIINGEDADAPAEYFDLMGRRIAAPQAGSIYIVRRGATVTKMIAK